MRLRSQLADHVELVLPMTRTWQLFLAGAVAGYAAASYARLEQLSGGWARAGVAALLWIAAVTWAWWAAADERRER